MHIGLEIPSKAFEMHTAKVTRKGEAHYGTMDEILTDSHLDTWIKRCMMNVIAPKLEYAGEVREQERWYINTTSWTCRKTDYIPGGSNATICST